MTHFSPKVEILAHFGDLIHKVDIDFDTSIQKYKEEQVLGQVYNKDDNNTYWKKVRFKLVFTSESLQKNDINEETNVIKYLKEVRMNAIEELRKVQDASLEYYKLNSSSLRGELTTVKNIEELRSKLFADKFHFQVRFSQMEKRLWIFDIFTFITDFYLPQTDIELLE